MNSVIGIIGGGNMARSLIGGLIARGQAAAQIIVSDPAAAPLEQLQRDFGVQTTHDNLQVAARGHVLLFAVKPQEMASVCTAVQSAIGSHTGVVISVAAGIRAADIVRWLQDAPVVRAMPNRPALQGCGVTGLFATAAVSPTARALAEEVMNAVGATVWIEAEHHMDAVTAISGSGPAYFFLLIEMLETAGRSFGLDPEVSRRLAVETAYGSGMMAHHATEAPATLREQVTSKGGTTEAALRVLEAQGVRAIFAAALTAAERRSAELAATFGGR